MALQVQGNGGVVAEVDGTTFRAQRFTPRPAELTTKTSQIIKQLDSEGRWVSTFAGEGLVGQPKFASGDRYLSSEIFSRNLIALAEFLAATK